MAYVICGMRDCKNHNKRKGCKLQHIFIIEHSNEELPCGENGVKLDNNTYCAYYEKLES